jgi:hypothetical protein
LEETKDVSGSSAACAEPRKTDTDVSKTNDETSKGRRGKEIIAPSVFPK